MGVSFSAIVLAEPCLKMMCFLSMYFVLESKNQSSHFSFLLYRASTNKCLSFCLFSLVPSPGFGFISVLRTHVKIGFILEIWFIICFFLWYRICWKIENSISWPPVVLALFSSFRNPHHPLRLHFLISSSAPRGRWDFAAWHLQGYTLARHRKIVPVPRVWAGAPLAALLPMLQPATARHYRPSDALSQLRAGPQSPRRPPAWLTPTAAPHTTAARWTPFDLVGWAPSFEAEAAGAARTSSGLQQGRGVRRHRVSIPEAMCFLPGLLLGDFFLLFELIFMFF
jgi:hypothetical protein